MTPESRLRLASEWDPKALLSAFLLILLARVLVSSGVMEHTYRGEMSDD
jgi:hypothetical protein